MLIPPRLAQRAAFAIRSLLVTASLLLLPSLLFFAALAPLLLLFGGHRHAILGANPFCALPVDPAPPAHLNASSFSLILHISDLHVNDIDSGKVKANLHRFAHQALPKWAPLADAIVATGDLVHSVRSNPYPIGRSSAQLDSEWVWLHDYVARLNTSVPWFSTYGNHDTFGRHVPPDMASHFCPKPSSPTAHTRVRRFDCPQTGPVVLALDGTPIRPLHAPLNFFGDASVAAPELDQTLRNLSTDPESSHRDVIVMSHYPTSTLSHGRRVSESAFPTNPAPDSHQLPRYAAYLSGHLHNLYGGTMYGLQVVARSGALELEVPDLGRSGTYRAFVAGAGHLAFKTFFLMNDTESTPSIRDVVFVNTPAAGMCKPGSGLVARDSDHIIILSPSLNLTEVGAELYIDGRFVGNTSDLFLTCSSGKPCEYMYGVKWNASEYLEGTHEIQLTSAMHGSVHHVFSLDGAREPGLRAWLQRFIHATFAMSDFETIAELLCYLGVFLSFIASLPGIPSGDLMSFVLPVFALCIQFGPVFVLGFNLADDLPGFGLIGMRSVIIGSSTFRGTFDPSFKLSTAVLYPIIIPASIIRRLCQSHRPSGKFSRFSFLPAILLYLKASLNLCFEMLGAYGRLAAMLSPPCLPLFIACCLVAYSSVKACLSTRRGK